MKTTTFHIDGLNLNPDVTVLTVENVTLHWPIASIVIRSFAYITDFIFQLIIFTAGTMALTTIVKYGVIPESTLVIILVSWWILVFIAYFVLFEIFWNGQTLGKKMLKIRVIRLDGGRIGWREAILREIMRIVDFLPFGYAFGIIAIMTSSTQQRIGDRVAGTVIIQDSKISRSTQQRSDVYKGDLLTPDESLWITRFRERFNSLDVQKRLELAQKAYTYFSRRYPNDIQPVPDNPHAILAALNNLLAKTRYEA